MRKEVLWAIVAGVVFGLVIAFGAWRINLSIREKSGNDKGTPRPSSSPISEFKITLVGPENEDVVTEATTKVSGITKPLTWITISGEDGDYIIQADEKGVFEEDIDLVSGVNQIKITGYDPQGNQSIEKVLVVYSSAFEKKAVPAEPTGTGSTDSGIRERVTQKLQETINKPKAYIGVVTDITDSTIQIKTGGGEIRQISVDPEETTVVKTTPTNKIVKITDIAIGDFIVAMGYKNGNQVLAAQRILITPALTEPNITVTLGKGADVTPVKTTDILQFADGEVTRARASDVEDETPVIYVEVEVNEKPTLRTVFLLPS